MTNFPPSSRPPMGASLPSVSYVAPVLVTIFCCLIGGIVSIVYTAKANTAAATGDASAYAKLVGTRKTWITISIVVAVVLVLLNIVLTVLGVGLGGTTVTTP